jgi:hypothetical protein
MESFVPIGLVVVGFFAGTLIFAKVGRWMVTLYELLKERTEMSVSSKAAALVSASLLSSGPWIFILAVIFAYYVFSESWAVWVFVGFCGAIVFFSLLSIFLAHKAKRENAA